MWWKLRVGGKRNYPKWSWKYRFIFNLALNQNLQRSQLEYARMIHSSPQLVCISKWERTNLAHPTPCTRTSSVQKLLQEFGHSPTNICYKTRPHSPKKVQASTHRPLTTKQINRCTHPLNSLLKLVQKVSPAKSPDTKNKENKCNLQLYLLVT